MLVEEKLDGANVTIWLDDELPRVATRGGPDAMDRGRQLGPLRNWVAQSWDRVGPLLDGDWVLYAEWLWWRHTVFYDSLPEHLVALDLFHQDHGFADRDARTTRFRDAGLTPPPRLFDGVLGSSEHLLSLMATSYYGHEAMEGVVLRRGDHELSKVVRPGFARATDDALGRVRNMTRPAQNV